MQITKGNFDVLYPGIEKAIEEADFISYDLEYSCFLEEKEFITLSSEYVYNSMATAPNQPRILQFGMCCFKIIEGNPLKLICTPISCSTTPANSKKFTFNSKSFEFLSSTNFDFNKCIKEAIPYYTIPEFEELKDIEEKKKKKIMEMENMNNNKNTEKIDGEKKKTESKSLEDDKGKLSSNGNTDESNSLKNGEDIKVANISNNNNNGDENSDFFSKKYGTFINSTAKQIVSYYENYFASYINEHHDMFSPLPETTERDDGIHPINDREILIRGDLDPLMVVPFTDIRYSPKMRMILRRCSIPLAMETIRNNYKTGYVNPETKFEYTGEPLDFGLSFLTLFSDRDNKFLSLELFKSTEDVEWVTKRRQLLNTLEYKKGFSRILDLFKKYKKPLVLFSALGDLFLLFREYIIGYDKVISDGLKKQGTDTHNNKNNNNNKGNNNKQKNKKGMKLSTSSTTKNILSSESTKNKKNVEKQNNENNETHGNFKVPKNSIQFAKLVHEYFPVIIDLKSIFDSPTGYEITYYKDSETMCNEPVEGALKNNDSNEEKQSQNSPKEKPYKVKAANGSLEALYNFLMSPRTKPLSPSLKIGRGTEGIIGGPIDISVVNKLGEQPSSLEDATSLYHAHDASYDAYMTGSSFIMLCLRAKEYSERMSITSQNLFRLQILPDQLFLFRSTEYYTLKDEYWNNKNHRQTRHKSLINVLNKVSHNTALDIYDLSYFETNIDGCECAILFAPRNLKVELPEPYEAFFKRKAAPFINAMSKFNLTFSIRRLGNILLIKLKHKANSMSEPTSSSQTSKEVKSQTQSPSTVNETQNKSKNDQNLTKTSFKIEPTVSEITFPKNWNSEMDIKKLLPGFPEVLVDEENKDEGRYGLVTLSYFRVLETKNSNKV